MGHLKSARISQNHLLTFLLDNEISWEPHINANIYYLCIPFMDKYPHTLSNSFNKCFYQKHSLLLIMSCLSPRSIMSNSIRCHFSFPAQTRDHSFKLKIIEEMAESAFNILVPIELLWGYILFVKMQQLLCFYKL